MAALVLDLRAVEERHRATMRGFSSDPGAYVESVADVPALLGLLRETREALQRMHNVALRVTLVPSGANAEWLLALDEAANVLSQAVE